MHDDVCRSLSSKARVRTLRNAVTAAFLTLVFMALPVMANGQTALVDPSRRASAASIPAALDVDRLVAEVLERGVLLQRTRSRSRPTGNSNTMKWVGVGMLGLGGLLALNGALSTCGADFNVGRAGSVSIDTSMCTGRVGIGGGIAAAGLFMMLR